MHRAISMYYPIQCFSLPLRCCQADFSNAQKRVWEQILPPAWKMGVLLLWYMRGVWSCCSRHHCSAQICLLQQENKASQVLWYRWNLSSPHRWETVSSKGAQTDVHLHKHQWLPGWHWNYEISQLLLGSQSRGHSQWDPINMLKQILSYHPCSVFSKAAWSCVCSKEHSVKCTRRLLLRM